MTSTVSEAAEVGQHAATIEQGLYEHGQEPNDRIHHVGDDTGHIITRAYRAGGAAAATDALEAYLAAFNTVREKHGRAPLRPQDAISNLQWAITPKGIGQTEQAEVRAEFARRNSK